MTLLVADDDNMWREIHRRKLTELGYLVHVVSSGDEAEKALRSYRAYRGAILDNSMDPGEHGSIILANIREGCYGDLRKDMPVLIVSGDVNLGFRVSVEDMLRGKCLDKSDAHIEYEGLVKQLFGDPLENGHC